MKVQTLAKDGADYNCTFDHGADRCNRVTTKGIDLDSMRKFNELKRDTYTNVLRALCDEHIAMVEKELS